MGQVLYRKYRSRNLDELIGQEHITTTLKHALKAGAISHAYLFTGPRGTGKTSVARILAHQLNELDYASEDTHLDIIEIDAASNRGIDEIRDLREKVSTAPSSGKYKVYIIDEVHMLTTPAFNALLKTLEEPPAHVVFILATTEAHKLPETIISRTQRYTFRPVEQSKVAAHLKHIAEQEKIRADDAALQLIAAHGEGSFRDSISLLDQAASRGGTVTDKTVRDVLGIPAMDALEEILSRIATGDIQAVSEKLADLQSHGYQAAAIAKQLAELCRADLMDGHHLLEPEALLQLMAGLIDVPSSVSPDRMLEVVLLRSTVPTTKTMGATVSQASVRTKREPNASVPKQSVPAPANPTTAPAKNKESSMHTTHKNSPTAAEAQPPTAHAADVAGQVDRDILAIWPDVLNAMKKQYNTIYGILRMAEPRIIEGRLILVFQYAFHQKRIQDVKQRQIISTVIENLTGRNIEIECQHNSENSFTRVEVTAQGEAIIKPVQKPGRTDPGAETDSLKTVSNIFGGGELLES